MRLPTDLKRVLVIDDTESFRHLVARFLEPKGVMVRGAATGEDGIPMARSFRPDIIILDWVLKGMSGEYFARQLRQDAATQAIPTIMVSAVKEPADAGRAVRAGADAFLTKDQIQAVLQSYRRPEAVPRPERRRILVIEDDEGTQDFIRYVLTAKDYELEFVNDGAIGLQTARLSRPALILLDLGLPGMNGVEVFNLLRAGAATGQIPILLMTAMADDSSVIDSLLHTLRPADFIHKPIGGDELSARVARILDAPPAVDAAASDSKLKDLVLERGRIRMDLTANKIYVDSRPVRLPPRRFALLRILLSHQEPLSVERLLAEGWAEAKDPGTVKKTIQRLRYSLGLTGDPIVTVGHGYKLVG